MIVDCHTHIWQSPDQIGLRTGVRKPRPVRSQRESASAGQVWQATPENHATACQPVDVAIVLGFASRRLGAGIPNEFIADYARTNPGRVIGFAGIDPTDPVHALEELHRARQQLDLKGVVVSPACGGFHPAHTDAMRLYEAAAAAGMPVVVHNGQPLCHDANLEFARPVLLDEIARTFPRLKIVITEMGSPWIEETLVLLAKHENIYADISGIVHKPWTAYHYLQLAHEWEVMDKLLFGSGFPYSTPTAAIEALYSINQLVHQTNLPSIPRERLRGIVERNVLELLGIDLTSVSQASEVPQAREPQETPQAAGDHQKGDPENPEGTSSPHPDGNGQSLAG